MWNDLRTGLRDASETGLMASTAAPAQRKPARTSSESWRGQKLLFCEWVRIARASRKS